MDEDKFNPELLNFKKKEEILDIVSYNKKYKDDGIWFNCRLVLVRASDYKWALTITSEPKYTALNPLLFFYINIPNHSFGKDLLINLGIIKNVNKETARKAKKN